MPAPDFATSLRPVDGGVELTLTARVLLRDVCLFADRLDPAAEVDDMLVTLLPGESARFIVRSPRPLDPAALTCPPVGEGDTVVEYPDLIDALVAGGNDPIAKTADLAELRAVVQPFSGSAVRCASAQTTCGRSGHAR